MQYCTSVLNPPNSNTEQKIIQINLSMNAHLKYAHLNRISENPTVSILLQQTPPVEESVLCLTVLELFQNNSGIFAIPIVNSDNIPLGIVDRHSFIDIFIKPYTKEIYGKK